MRTTYTPGPWSITEDEKFPNAVLISWAYGGAEVHGASRGREANARLIAAAPDLLEALINLRHGSDIPGGPALAAMQEAADAAIAKALGKE